jgi:hypothetical protein
MVLHPNEVLTLRFSLEQNLMESPMLFKFGYWEKDNQHVQKMSAAAYNVQNFLGSIPPTAFG